jgi:shikimate kinase
MATERIYLVGFMGAGKSTVGHELSLQLHRPFFDVDDEIERVEGLSVAEIFNRFGESRFRQLEREHLKRLSAMPGCIVALGGGAYIDPENRKVADETGTVVWLDASLESIRQRVRPDGTRPLLSDPEQVEKLYASRLPFYKLARIHVLTDNRLPHAIAQEIIRCVGELEGSKEPPKAEYRGDPESRPDAGKVTKE